MGMSEFIADLRTEIEEHIATVQKHGWSIEREVWISPKRKCCCALGAGLVIDAAFEPTTGYSVDAPLNAQGKYDLNSDEVYSVADGFDNQPYVKGRHVFALWLLGRDLAHKYVRGDEDEAPVTIPESR